MSTLPLVLVHGGAHGAWCWEPMLDVLATPALAVDLPPKGIRGVSNPDRLPPELGTITLGDWAASTIDDVDAAGFERFVLVGHSMGGLTIAEVARRAPERIAHLVFVSCMVPPEGGIVLEGVPSLSSDAARELMAPDAAQEPAARAGLGRDAIREMFCNDMTDEQTEFVLARTGAEVGSVFGERVSRRGIPPTLPKTYVRLGRDQALPPEDQDRAIARLRESPGGEVAVVELDTGHDVMISDAEALARVLDRVIAGA